VWDIFPQRPLAVEDKVSIITALGTFLMFQDIYSGDYSGTQLRIYQTDPLTLEADRVNSKRYVFMIFLIIHDIPGV